MAVYGMKRGIRRAMRELDGLEEASEMPEMISSANLLRSNEYLSRANEKRAEIIEAYGRYAAALEGMLAVALEIQDELKEILRAQSEMIGPKKPRRRARK